MNSPLAPLNPVRYQTAEDAVNVIKSGDRIFIHSACATPHMLIKAMVARYSSLRDVEIVHLHTDGEAPYVQAPYSDAFCVKSFFVGANVRKATQQGLADYIPIFLSEIPLLLRRGKMPINVALIQVSPPDRHGYCSLGISVDATRAAVSVADHVIAQVNRNMPRTHGDSLLHISNINSFVQADEPLGCVQSAPCSEANTKIGNLIANELVEDGATLQMGIGAIPDAVLRQLTHHKDLGIHTEMFAEGVIDLVEAGVVTGKYKANNPGTIVTGFLMGSERLYRYVDDNPSVRVLDIEYVNDVSVIRKNPKVTAINSAIEIDLSGQVCADSIGTAIYSGVGGQMDFIRGASLSEGGKPIIALPSVTNRGESRIVSMLKPGAGVVTTRAHVHYVVTEYGIADLYGKSLQQRAQALIAIAHPQHREALTQTLKHVN